MGAADDADRDLSPEQVADHLAEGWQVIDVREPYEREAGLIAGTRHIEVGRLASEASTSAIRSRGGRSALIERIRVR